MLRLNLTVKILIAVGVTVAVVIAIYTYFVIRVQSQWWYERAQAQNVLAASMATENLGEAMVSNRKEEVRVFLQDLQKSQDILRGRIIDPDGNIIFSTETNEIKRATFTTPPELFATDKVLYGSREENGKRLAIVFAPIKNQDACAQCHKADFPYLGAVVMEKLMETAESNIATNRNLLLAYGVVIFVLVGFVLWLLIVRLVTQPVGALVDRMRHVQQGDLTTRIEAQSQDEIGELARGFNSMVQSLETTRRELHESHEKQIQQADKLASIGELASGIAHEIRNPLAGIGAAVEVLAENNNGNGQYAEVVGEIRTQIARLNRTLNNLLDFARTREPEVAPCDVRALIEPMIGLVRPDAQKYHVKIVEEFAENLPPISADPQQMQQVILNILLNAVQAMPNGGTLTVKVESRTGILPVPPHAQRNDRQDACPTFVRITISDTGVGIARENLHKIFSPFYTTKHRGTGLGLSITRDIVEKHNGTINVESEIGRGATFVLEFAACSYERERADFAENHEASPLAHAPSYVETSKKELTHA